MENSQIPSLKMHFNLCLFLLRIINQLLTFFKKGLMLFNVLSFANKQGLFNRSVAADHPIPTFDFIAITSSYTDKPGF